MITDHISRILVDHMMGTDEVKEKFSDEQFFATSFDQIPWFAHIINYLAIGQVLHWIK